MDPPCALTIFIVIVYVLIDSWDSVPIQQIIFKSVITVKVLGCTEASCFASGYGIILLGLGFAKHPSPSLPAWQLIDDFIYICSVYHGHQYSWQGYLPTSGIFLIFM